MQRGATAGAPFNNLTYESPEVVARIRPMSLCSRPLMTRPASRCPAFRPEPLLVLRFGASGTVQGLWGLWGVQCASGLSGLESSLGSSGGFGWGLAT